LCKRFAINLPCMRATASKPTTAPSIPKKHCRNV
jgi:hypothetical protein